MKKETIDWRDYAVIAIIATPVLIAAVAFQVINLFQFIFGKSKTN